MCFLDLFRRKPRPSTEGCFADAIGVQIQQLQVSELRPGDLLVVRVPFPLSLKQREIVANHLVGFRSRLPESIHFVVLDAGMSLEVVRLGGGLT